MPETRSYLEALEQTLELFRDEQEMICRAIVIQDNLHNRERNDQELQETTDLLSAVIALLIDQQKIKIL